MDRLLLLLRKLFNFQGGVLRSGPRGSVFTQGIEELWGRKRFRIMVPGSSRSRERERPASDGVRKTPCQVEGFGKLPSRLLVSEP